MKRNLEVRMEYITPEKAQLLLERNTGNRVAKESHVCFLSKQMSNGLFLENGESIVFDKHGELKDGQHRLLAIINSGKSYHIPVVTGVDKETMATFDTGKNRSAGDILYLNGFHYGNEKAAFCHLYFRYVVKESKHSNNGRGDRNRRITNQEVLNFVSKNDGWINDIISKVSYISSKQKPRVLSTVNLSFLAYMIGGKNPSSNDYEYLKEVCGVSRKEGTSGNYIFTKLYESRQSKETLSFYWFLGASMRGYKYFIEGNPAVKFIRFDVSQDLPEINK
jgi:hypothetical protein